MELKRTFHAIGQGAFYTERFYENKTNVFNVVYDCGTLNAQKNLVYQIHAEFAQRTEIEYLFISHFHKDHISGIKELDRYCSIKNYVVPVISPQMLAESVLHDYFWVKTNGYGGNWFNDLFDVLEMIFEEKDPIQIGEGRRTLQVSAVRGSWVYIPYNPSRNPVNDIIVELKNHQQLVQLAEAFENLDFDKVKEEIQKADLDELKDAYYTAFNGHHCYVMPVYSGYDNPTIITDERVCLYTGDYDAGDVQKVDALIKPISKKWDAIGTLQVPHHGSRYNSCQELYMNQSRVFVISSFGPSKYHHPHGETIGYICNGREVKLQLVGGNPSLPSYSKSFII